MFRNTVGKNVTCLGNRVGRLEGEPAVFVVCLVCFSARAVFTSAIEDIRYQMVSFYILLIIGISGWFSVLYSCSSSSLPLLILLLFYLCSIVEFE